MIALMGAVSPAAWWGLLAGIPAVTAEYLYRLMASGTITAPWWKMLPLWLPIQLCIGYCIYRMVSIPNTTLLDAFVVWAFSTTFLRVVISIVILGETVKGGTWFALALLIMARVAQVFWGR